MSSKVTQLVDCPVCGGSGFSGLGTGYDDVCGECGGTKQVHSDAPNPLTQAAMEEARTMRHARYATPAALFDALVAEDQWIDGP